MFPVISVNPDLAENVEQLGTKRKYWYRRDGVRTLFKAEERGTGEDWAEKIACELSLRIGLPHVHYELAEEQGTNKPGVICASCAIRPVALVLGNQIMLALDKAYPADESNRYKVKEHTVEAVAGAVELLRPLPEQWLAGLPEGVESALDVFVGYIMLDAWIANQDRHHENWGVLWDQEHLRLAPSFDHGAAMARNLTDEERVRRLESNDKNYQLPAFAAKARSAFYQATTDRKPLTTHDAARAFMALRPEAAEIWRRRMGQVDTATIGGILDEVPPSRMSKVGKQFTLALLTENHRLLVEDPG